MLVFPRTDIFDLCRISDTTFWPRPRQELSRSANGVTRVKDLGSPLWMASFTTAPVRLEDAGAIEMALMSLNGSEHAFEAYDVRRPYPLAHADGNFSDTGTINAIGANNKSLQLAGLPVGFSLTVGDYLAFDYGTPSNRALHRVAEGTVADGLGVTGTFEVYPHIAPGATVGAAVTLKKPSCLMIQPPDAPPPSLVGMAGSSIVFSGIQLIV